MRTSLRTLAAATSPAVAEGVLVSPGHELLETRSNPGGKLSRTTCADALLEDRQTRPLLLFAVMDQELAKHTHTRGEREVTGSCNEQALEREAKERVLLERSLFGAARAVSERINELLFGERMTDDLVGEGSNQAALRSRFGSIEEIDDAAMLLFQNFFER